MVTFILNVYEALKEKQTFNLKSLNTNLENIIDLRTKELTVKTQELQNEKEKYEKLYVIDQLTKLYNRHYIIEVLQQSIKLHKRYQKPSSIIMADIDYFKSINDKFGHNIGDQVLIKVSQILKSSLRESDMIGRWGGEEFLIILTETNIQKALTIADKIMQTVRGAYFPTVNNLTLSFGVAEIQNSDTIETFVDRADKSLYKAKERGRNRIEH